MIELNDLPHQTFTIINRLGVELFVRLNGAGNKPLALVAHGLSDVHDTPHMRAIASGLVEAGLDVVTFDASNSWGRSGGESEWATLTAAYFDLCDVHAWLATQDWFTGPVILAGHSLGGAAALRFTTDNPSLVGQLIMVAPVVSGRMLANRLPGLVRLLWRKVGRLPELGKRGKWYRYDLLADGLDYDGPKLAAKLMVPTTVIAAAKDATIPLAHQRLLEQAMPRAFGHLRVIAGANHTFSKHLDELTHEVALAAKKVV